jgi:hypothetical protein
MTWRDRRHFDAGLSDDSRRRFAAEFLDAIDRLGARLLEHVLQLALLRRGD